MDAATEKIWKLIGALSDAQWRRAIEPGAGTLEILFADPYCPVSQEDREIWSELTAPGNYQALCSYIESIRAMGDTEYSEGMFKPLLAEARQRNDLAQTSNDTAWTFVGESAQSLELELSKELAAGHPLFGHRVRAVARRIDNDEVLFEVDSPNYPYAMVHLTWSGKPESDPTWPSTQLFPAWEDWVERRAEPMCDD